MAATMILGALLVISVVLTVVAWISRNGAVRDFNDLQRKFDDTRMQAVQDIRQKHHTEVRGHVGVAPGCPRCPQLKRELDGMKHELRKAYASLSDEEVDALHYNYDVTTKNVTLNLVADPSNANLELLQISFTLKNQATAARGNILGYFKLYKDKKMVWQKKFDIPTLAPGATTHKQFMAPGRIDWDGWGCQIYPSTPSSNSALPRR
jgi:hypothetical protein